MKPSAIILLALVGSMVVAGIPSRAFADQQLDSLLRIANQARDNIKIRLSQLATVPDEISKLYEQGSAETDALAQSVTDEDISSARQHFLSAMRLFKEASDRISSSAPIVDEPLPTTDNSRLKTVIAKIEKAGDRLKAVAAKNNVEIDFTEFDKLLQIARQNLEEGKTDEVNKTLEIARQFILGAHNSISSIAKQKLSDRAKGFASKQIERLDKLIAQAKELSLSQDIIDTLLAAKAKLLEISNATQIVIETKEINTIKEKLDASKVNRINAIIHQLEIKLDRIESGAQNDDSTTKIANVRDMFVEVKQLVSDGKLEEALQKIKSIDEILDSIDASTTNEPAKAITPDSKAKAGTKTDSRLERMKIKIQNLEDQANSLSEEVSGNEVATQWLKRAFSLIDDAKSKLDESPAKAMRTLNEVDKILHMIQKMIS